MKQIRYSNFRSNYSPFSNKDLKKRIESLGFLESSLFKSDLLICKNLKNARIASGLFPLKKIMVWTHEPRYDSTPRKIMRGVFGQKIFIFNVFTGNVFFNNSHFFGSYHYDDSNDLGITLERISDVSSLVDQMKFDSRKCLFGALRKKNSSYFNFSSGNNGNLDGNFIRQSLIEYSIWEGIGEVAGENWNELALENSSHSNFGDLSWWDRKIELMSDYKFSIAIENTIYPYYVTEKIWQSIKAITLPIYIGEKSSIYEIFPPDSFIDYSEFSSNIDLLNYIRKMDYKEWTRRMNFCIQVYNDQVDLHLKSPPDQLYDIISKVKEEISFEFK